MRTWGRVLRLSLSATAVADVVAGTSLATMLGHGGGIEVLPVLGLVFASLCVYHGGMALNDWADREVDARERPERPIPSGQVSASAVLAVALALFALGVFFAFLVTPLAGVWMAGVALLAALYDVVGRGPLRGPLLLALCRAGNLSTPLVAFGVLGSESWPLLFAPLAYGAYVFIVSRLGRLEDAEEALLSDAQPRRLVLALATTLMIVPFLPISSASLVGRAAAFALCVAAAATLWRAAAGVKGWTRGDVERTMGYALRRLLIFTCALAVLPGGPQSWLFALLILAGYPLAKQLRGIFPPS